VTSPNTVWRNTSLKRSIWHPAPLRHHLEMRLEMLSYSKQGNTQRKNQHMTSNQSELGRKLHLKLQGTFLSSFLLINKMFHVDIRKLVKSPIANLATDRKNPIFSVLEFWGLQLEKNNHIHKRTNCLPHAPFPYIIQNVVGVEINDQHVVLLGGLLERSAGAGAPWRRCSY
jgi:hypothetical protein